MRWVIGAMAIAGCVESGPWDATWEVRTYRESPDACDDAAVDAAPDAPMVNVSFGVDSRGDDRVQVHTCDAPDRCDAIPRWTATLRSLTDRRIDGASAEILALDGESGATCSLAWNALELTRSGRDLAMEVRAWGVSGLQVGAAAECDAELEYLQSLNMPCEGYWSLTARAVD